MSTEDRKSPKLVIEPQEADAKPAVPPKDEPASPDDILPEEPLKSEIPPSAPSNLHTAEPTTGTEEVPPTKPPRPQTEFDKHIATLQEAFPAVEPAVIKAVLTASGGKVEPAFVALLGMNDPSFVAEDAPPAKPPRPTGPITGYAPASEWPGHQTSTPMTQLEADELYARQLAQHYSTGGTSTGQRRQGDRSGNRQAPQQRPPGDRAERSFIDDLKDDIPEITENIKKGFFETQSKVTKWVGDLRKRIDGDDAADLAEAERRAVAAREQQQQYPQRQSSRRSGDNYDADPRVLEDDFSHLELRDNTDTRAAGRPVANPNLFDSDRSPMPRKVSFQNQSDEDLYGTPTTVTKAKTGPQTSGTTASTTSSSSKWAPLATVEPTPLNNDPFSLGDSDDEHETTSHVPAKTGPQESGTTTSTTTEKTQPSK